MTRDLPEIVDASVLRAMTMAQPALVGALRIAVFNGESDQEILVFSCHRGASGALLRQIAHCLSAIRKETRL